MLRSITAFFLLLCLVLRCSVQQVSSVVTIVHIHKPPDIDAIHPCTTLLQVSSLQ